MNKHFCGKRVKPKNGRFIEMNEEICLMAAKLQNGQAFQKN